MRVEVCRNKFVCKPTVSSANKVYNEIINTLIATPNSNNMDTNTRGEKYFVFTVAVFDLMGRVHLLTWGAFPKSNYGRKFRRYQ